MVTRLIGLFFLLSSLPVMAGSNDDVAQGLKQHYLPFEAE